MNRISADTLRGWITDGQELALLDAREDGEFGASHLFWAIPCGLARKEIRVRALLPRLSVRICCVDDGRGLAEILAAWLESIGATDVSVLDGGTKAWEAAGYVLFSGVNVPSKAFGEWVEHHYGTESVDAPELKAWIDSGRDMVVLDSRTLEEFTRMSIPTGISVPGGELAYRIGDLVPDPKTLVVVNCAGRTRSIMGAESLRRAGIPNKVVALRNGTMGWELAGLRCERGRTEKFELGTPKTAALALQRARAFADHSGVGVIGPLDLSRFEDDPDRTLYVLDVRDPVEFRAGHRPGSRNAPGGQLGAGDRWLDRRAQRSDRAGGRYRRAGADDRRLAAADGASRRVRGRRRAGGDQGDGQRRRAGAGTGGAGEPAGCDRAGAFAGQRGRDAGARSGAQRRLPGWAYSRRGLGCSQPSGGAAAATVGGGGMS